jgi:hypothetical protein
MKIQLKKQFQKNMFKFFLRKQRLQRRNNQCEIRTNLKAPEKNKCPKTKTGKICGSKC